MPAWERKANYTKSSIRAVGGKLTAEGGWLTFTPHMADRAMFADPVSLPLDQVQAFEVESVNLRQLFGGGLRKRLAVVMKDGRRELFVVSDVEQAVEELRALAQS